MRHRQNNNNINTSFTPTSRRTGESEKNANNSNGRNSIIKINYERSTIRE